MLHSFCAGRQSPLEGRIISLLITCGPHYPDRPPTIRFSSRVNLACVDQRTGVVSKPFHRPLFPRLEPVLTPLDAGGTGQSERSVELEQKL